MQITAAGIGFTPSSGTLTYAGVALTSVTGRGRDATADITIQDGIAIGATINAGGSDYVVGDIVSPIADLHFDLHKIPLNQNTFDVVFCNHVFEHVENDLKCMKEIYRVMKKGGWGIFQVPIDYNNKKTYEDPSITDPKEREIHFWQKDHVRLYGLDYPKKLEKAGFKVEIFNPRESLPNYDYSKLRLNPSELIYIASK